MEERFLIEDISAEQRASIREKIDKDIMEAFSKLEETSKLYGADDEEDNVTSIWVDLDDVDEKIKEFKDALYNDSIDAFIPYSATCREDIYSQAVYWLRHYKANKFVYNMSYFMYFANLAEVYANFCVMYSEIMHNPEIDINFDNYQQYEDKFRLNKQMKYIRYCFDILHELYYSDNVEIWNKVNDYLKNFSEGNLRGRRCPFFKLLCYRRKIERYYKKQYAKALYYAIETKLKEKIDNDD